MNVIEDKSKETRLIKPSSVGFIIINRQIVLIKRDKIPGLHDAGRWTLPGGELDPEETYNEALKRELKEELNIDVTKLKLPNSVIQIGGNKAMGAIHGLYCIQITEDEGNEMRLGDEGKAIGKFNINTLIDHVDELGINFQFLVRNGLPELLNAIIDKKDINLDTLGFKIIDLPGKSVKI